MSEKKTIRVIKKGERKAKPASKANSAAEVNAILAEQAPAESVPVE